MKVEKTPGQWFNKNAETPAKMAFKEIAWKNTFLIIVQ